MVTRLILACTLSLGAAAWPCSGDTYREALLFVSPAPGSTGVPLNAEVKFVFSGKSHGADAFSLRDLTASEDVAFTTSTTLSPSATWATAVDHLVRLRPSQPLRPRHTYTVTLRQEVSRFGSGDGVDATPPRGPRTVGSTFEYEEETCFGDTIRYWLGFDAPADEYTPPGQVIFLAMVDGPAGPTEAVIWPSRPRPSPLPSRGETLPTADEPTAPRFGLGQTLGQGNYRLDEPRRLTGTLQALDWAGNAGPAVPFKLSPGLAGTRLGRVWHRLEVAHLAGTVRGVVIGCAGLTLVAVALGVRRARRPR